MPRVRFRDIRPPRLRLRRIVEIRRLVSTGCYDPDLHLEAILGDLAADLEFPLDLAHTR